MGEWEAEWEGCLLYTRSTMSYQNDLRSCGQWEEGNGGPIAFGNREEVCGLRHCCLLLGPPGKVLLKLWLAALLCELRG